MMKRLLMGLMLVMTATVVSADWTLVDSSAELIQYADRATVRRKGDFVQMWNLRDLKKISTNHKGNYYFSQKAQEEYDCKGEKIRLLALVQYGEKGRTGD